MEWPQVVCRRQAESVLAAANEDNGVLAHTQGVSQIATDAVEVGRTPVKAVRIAIEQLAREFHALISTEPSSKLLAKLGRVSHNRSKLHVRSLAQKLASFGVLDLIALARSGLQPCGREAGTYLETDICVMTRQHHSPN